MNPHLILVFLKEPVPGRVKTRLAADVGAEAAAAIYRRLVREVFRCLEEVDDARVRVLFDPPESESAIREWIGKISGADLEFRPQAPGDLGARLKAAFAAAFDDGFRKVMAIGTDCIGLEAEDFSETWRKLDSADAVFGPVRDGGYYLIGLGKMEPRLFDVPWSSPETLERSLEQARECGLETALLESKLDVDTAADWDEARAYLIRQAKPADEPLCFVPVYREKIWGGRNLETLFGRRLPDPDKPYGESWEMVDRREAQSVVKDGPLAGLTLGDLWTYRRDEIFGESAPLDPERFPLLLKILDANDDLSIQVHPPAEVAEELDGEPKTEMWYIAHAEPGAKLYVGLRKGVSRRDFERGIREGMTKRQVHAIEVREGDCLFIPSGRLHAIGAGLVIFEIQQNSDTTYRVFDWNRMGLDGKPRELHVEQSLKSIDFEDVEPGLAEVEGETLVNCAEFHVEKWSLSPGQSRTVGGNGEFSIVTVIQGRVNCGSSQFQAGDFFMTPAGTTGKLAVEAAEGEASILRTRLPKLEVITVEWSAFSDKQKGFYRKLRAKLENWADSKEGADHRWVQLLLTAPDLFHLLCCLMLDPDVPGRMKVQVGAVIAYFISPIDLMPEAMFGPAGYMDDIALAAFVLNRLLNEVSPDVLYRHWAGDEDVLKLIRRISASADDMLGEGLMKKVNRWLDRV